MDFVKVDSLLWPKGNESFYRLNEKTKGDLDMSYVFEALEDVISDTLSGYLTKMPISKEIVKYRQEIMRDFIINPKLLGTFKKIMTDYYKFKNMIKFAFEREYTLYNLIKRLEESELVLNDFQLLYTTLKEVAIESRGLLNLRQLLGETLENPVVRSYASDMKEIRQMPSVRSIKIGLNLDENLSPIQAIVLSVEEEPFKYTRSLKKIGRVIDLGIDELKKLPRRFFAAETLIPKEDLNRIEKIIEPAMEQMIGFCDHFNNGLLDLILPLKEELEFYEFGVKVAQDLESFAIPSCFVTFDEEGPTQIVDLVNLNLAYKMGHEKTIHSLIANHMTMDQVGNILILTGANRGGKTTYTQSIGQVYWLGMLGMKVAARSASIHEIDGLYVHFPSEEQDTVHYGRLGEECRRFSEMFEEMSPRSLLLMNESFSGTSHLESLTIATEALRAVQLLGASCLFNTHLHELGQKVGELNKDLKGLKFKNLVAGTKEAPQSFEIKEGEPLGKSYAYDIARKYGVSYEQLIHES